MSEQLDYIGADELVFTNDAEKGVHSGGFSVKSILMKSGLSPIVTLNGGGGLGGDQVSDLFANLVVPNWALSYNNRLVQGGGGNNGSRRSILNEDGDDSDYEDDAIEDDLHDKLLELVQAPLPAKAQEPQEGGVKRGKHKKTRRFLVKVPKKRGTRRSQKIE